eukprot:6722411-Prymnesium_polylepis.1
MFINSEKSMTPLPFLSSFPMSSTQAVIGTDAPVTTRSASLSSCASRVPSPDVSYLAKVSLSCALERPPRERTSAFLRAFRARPRKTDVAIAPA